MTTILAHGEVRTINLTLAITIIAAVLLLLSIASYTNHLRMAKAQPELAEPEPWPSVATFWARVTGVGGSAQTEFTGCYADVLIVYMPGRGALTQDALVLTKDHNICTLLQTAFTKGLHGRFRANFMSDSPLPAAEGPGGEGPVYDIISICVRC